MNGNNAIHLNDSHIKTVGITRKRIGKIALLVGFCEFFFSNGIPLTLFRLFKVMLSLLLITLGLTFVTVIGIPVGKSLTLFVFGMPIHGSYECAGLIIKGGRKLSGGGSHRSAPQPTAKLWSQ